MFALSLSLLTNDILQATGINYLLSLNYSPSEADDFMRKFVPLVASAGPPVRKKQKSDPPAIEQFMGLTKAKLMAKMNELGVEDYKTGWKKQQLIDHLAEALAARKPSAVAAANNSKERSPIKKRPETKRTEDSPVPESRMNISACGVAAASPAKGLVQRAIAQHENRQKAPAREVSCESAAKEPRSGREGAMEDNVVPVDVAEESKPQEVIDVTMIEAEDEEERHVKIIESPVKPAPSKKENEPVAEAMQSKPALAASTTPTKSSPSIQIGKVQSAKKQLLGQGLADPPHQPVRFPRKHPVNKGDEKHPVRKVVEPAAAKKKPEPVKSVAKPKPMKEPRLQNETVYTPAYKTNGSSSYAYKMKERHAKLLMERNKRKDQLMQSKVRSININVISSFSPISQNPSSKLNLASNPTIDLNVNPETLFNGPADAERVLKDLREKYKAGGNDKSKTDHKAPATLPHMPLSKKPAQNRSDAPFTLSKAVKPTKSAKSSARDNYPMTDTEDSDYDTDDSEANAARRAAKHIPSWAKRQNLAPVLEAQNDPSFPINPDELFGSVTTCDLEAVFGRKSSRYRQPRTSGVWATTAAA